MKKLIFFFLLAPLLTYGQFTETSLTHQIDRKVRKTALTATRVAEILDSINVSKITKGQGGGQVIGHDGVISHGDSVKLGGLFKGNVFLKPEISDASANTLTIQSGGDSTEVGRSQVYVDEFGSLIMQSFDASNSLGAKIIFSAGGLDFSQNASSLGTPITLGGPTGWGGLQYRVTPSISGSTLVPSSWVSTNFLPINLGAVGGSSAFLTPVSSSAGNHLGIRSTNINSFNFDVGNGTAFATDGWGVISGSNANGYSYNFSFDPQNFKGFGAGTIYTENGSIGNGTGSKVGLGGIKYAADYSANFTVRSLVDKGYADGKFVTAVTGTSNRITSSGGLTPAIDISASYVGQASITTLGTIGTGVWNGTIVSVAKGGTGTATPGLIAGTNITSITGTWPNQTINASGGGGSGTVTSVTLTQPATGLTLTNSGSSQTTAASSTFALANDLAAVEGLASNGLAVRTATDTWTTRTITGTANQINVTNGDGVSGAPTLSLPSTLALPSGTTATTSAPMTGGTTPATNAYTDAAVAAAAQGQVSATGSGYAPQGSNNTVLTINGSGTAVWLNYLFDDGAISTGTSSTVANATGIKGIRTNFAPSSLIATYALTAPAAPYNGQDWYVTFNGTIAAGSTVVTSFSIVANSGQALMASVTPTTAKAGDTFHYQYYSSNSTWYRIIQ